MIILVSILIFIIYIFIIIIFLWWWIKKIILKLEKILTPTYKINLYLYNLLLKFIIIKSDKNKK